MTALTIDERSLKVWQRLRPTHKQILSLGTNPKQFMHVRMGQLEAWGNGFMLLVGNSPDVPWADVNERTDWTDMRRLLKPGSCPMDPLLYVEADGYSTRDRSLLIMAMLSPTDGAVLEHLTVNARMALFIERECRARFPEDWILGWRGNLSAEAHIHGCAQVHPRPLTYCVRGPAEDGWIGAGVLMPRTAGFVRARDGSQAVRYDNETRTYHREAPGV